MSDLEALQAELTRKWGEDAAQHALMRIVEKGWHLDPGANEVERFARVAAKHYALDQKMARVRQRLFDYSTEELTAAQSSVMAQAPTQERRAIARQTLSRLLRRNPTAVIRGMVEDHTQAAQVMQVAVGTVKSRLHRGRG